MAASTAAVVESSTDTNSEGVLLHICEMVAFLAKIETFDTIGINIGGDIDNLDLSCVPSVHQHIHHPVIVLLSSSLT